MLSQVVLFFFCCGCVSITFGTLTVDPNQDLFVAYAAAALSSDKVSFLLEEGTYGFSQQLLVSNGNRLTIRGVSKELTILDCQNNKRAFEVVKGELFLFDLTIQNCSNTMVLSSTSKNVSVSNLCLPY